MKKTICALVTMTLMFAMATAYAAVASKTTTDNTRVETITTASGAPVVEDMVIEVISDMEPVIDEITNLYSFVNAEQKAPVEYFPTEVQAQIAQMLPEMEDISTLECNEFVSINTSGYKAEYGDVVAKFEFVTTYKVGQKVVALVSVFTNEKDANGNYIVTWLPLEAIAQEDGTLAVTLTEEALLMMDGAYSVALTVLSEQL